MLIYGLWLSIILPCQSLTEISKTPVVIDNNFGGHLYIFDHALLEMAMSRQKFVIKGFCLSACARFMMLDTVCAAPRSYFGFHAVRNWKTDELNIPLSKSDAKDNNLPAAFALETKYNSFEFGFETRPIFSTNWEEVEEGVAIFYLNVSTDNNIRFQKFLMVKADRLIPRC